MDVDVEIHVPGLDMSQSRWSYHLLFMQDVHERLTEIARRARDENENLGRGTLFVTLRQWREIVGHTIDESGGPFPADYVPTAEIDGLFAGTPVRSVFVSVLADYDPEEQFVLTVHHPPDGALSCYLVNARKTPSGE